MARHGKVGQVQEGLAQPPLAEAEPAVPAVLVQDAVGEQVAAGAGRQLQVPVGVAEIAGRAPVAEALGVPPVFPQAFAGGPGPEGQARPGEAGPAAPGLDPQEGQVEAVVQAPGSARAFPNSMFMIASPTARSAWSSG